MEELGWAHPCYRNPPEDLFSNRLHVLGRTALRAEEVNWGSLGDRLLKILLLGEHCVEDVRPVEVPELPLVGVMERKPLPECYEVAEHPKLRVVLFEGEVDGPLDVGDAL